MSAENELLLWLRRKETSFTENLRFALKAWQSTELTQSKKYETILSWIIEDAAKSLKNGDIPIDEFSELLQLRAQPSLVAYPIKVDIVTTILKLVEQASRAVTDLNLLRKLPELLRNLLNFEALQDLFRTNYELEAQLYARILQHYNNYLIYFFESYESMGERQIEKSFKTQWNAEREAIFFTAIISSLNDTVRRVGDQTRFSAGFTEHIICPLIQVIIILRQLNLDFFEEVRTLEHELSREWDDEILLERLFKLPFHVQMITLECAIVSRRGVVPFIQSLLLLVFDKLQKPDSRTQNANLTMKIAAHTLDILRKHEINLNFLINEQSKGEKTEISALAFIGNKILPLVQENKEKHLKEVLILLCAALRLNPLILEQNIFQITVWMIVAPKQPTNTEDDNNDVGHIFEQYLTLLMDMFRRLSQTEKFVSHLLQILCQWVDKYDLITDVSLVPTEKIGKRKSTNVEVEKSASKRMKLMIETNEDSKEIERYYMNMLLQNFSQTDQVSFDLSKDNCALQSFPHLETHWPAATVGLAFSRLIASLVSKSSIVVWKSLLYSLQTELNCDQKRNELNNLFFLDMNAALLCQYFCGSRLAEHQQKFSEQINEQRSFTEKLLSKFGRRILTNELNVRTVNSFLELCFSYAAFNLVLSYYRPDSFTMQTSDNNEFYAYLNADEWKQMRKLVFESNQKHCKLLFYKLQSQQTEAKVLLKPYDPKNIANVEISLNQFLTKEKEDRITYSNQLEQYLESSADKSWILTNLIADERLDVIRSLRRPNINVSYIEDLNILTFTVLSIYAELIETFKNTKKLSNSLLAKINYNFASLYNIDIDDANVWKQTVQMIVDQINAYLGNNDVCTVPRTAVANALNQLQQLPIAYLRPPVKHLIFNLQLALYRDLKSTKDEIDQSSSDAFDILTELLHFGPNVPVLKYFSADKILDLFSPSECSQFYNVLFIAIANEEKGSVLFLQSLHSILLDSLTKHDGNLMANERNILMLTLEKLSELNCRPTFKRLQHHFIGLLEVYGAYVRHYFTVADEGSKKTKKFVQKTLAGFPAFASVVLKKSANKTCTKSGTTNENSDGNYNNLVIDEEFRRICKIYIGHSLDYRSSPAIRLLQTALHHRQEIHLDQDEVELLLSSLWRQLIADLSAKDDPKVELPNEKTIENVVKLIIGNKTNEDLLLTMKEILTISVTLKDTNFKITTHLLAVIGKCPFNTIKGAIFNDQFKQITHEITLRLRKDERQQFVGIQGVIGLLRCQKSVLENKTIGITLDNIDAVLAFLIDINIKKLLITDDNFNIFVKLHSAISQLCTTLLIQRHILLMDRVPQFLHIMKDLLQSLIWYKSDRQKDITLSPDELEKLTDLALKLEAMMHIIATHSTSIKRLAPFILMFTINLMISKNRATTLYSKIKTHIYSICYDLVGVCDHRVGRFILRCSNESARQVYEDLVKDHKKYHKFKGKV